MKLGELKPSGYNTYPDNYLIFGAALLFDSELSEIHRSAQTIGSAFGAVGGAFYGIQFLCMFAALGFSKQHVMIEYVTALFK